MSDAQERVEDARARSSLAADAVAMPLLRVSVVIATYNRLTSITRVLTELGAQTLAPTQFEVIVVDDGSAKQVRAELEGLDLPYRLRVLEQTNAGPAAARHLGIEHARGEIIVVVDDDMRLQPPFLSAHLEAHPEDSRRAVLGPFQDEVTGRLPVHQRMGTRSLRGVMKAVRDEGAKVPATALYSGNVSFRRSDYVAVGGFDPAFRISEDAELGVRLARSGVDFVFAEAATTIHASDHSDARAWMRRSINYGRADCQMAEKHPGEVGTSPWRFLWRVSRVSRPMLLLSALSPGAMRPVTSLAMLGARVTDWLRLDRVSEMGITFAYGLFYFRGVREHAGSLGGSLGGLRRYLNLAPPEELGFVGHYAKACADLVADHEALRRAAAKYKGTLVPASRLPIDLVQKIGFQMMAAYRMMRFFRAARLSLLAKVTSRMMRHLYGADVHWDADLAPGVILVHGMGLVVAPGTKVGPGCVLFQHVTLGANIHPDSRETGVPTLERDVHVGPGATILGPITIGADTKITASALLTRSVPPHSLVETTAPVVRPRPGSRSPVPLSSTLLGLLACACPLASLAAR